ncbi:hypothetical protein Droror1_Dr00015700 [Drosera rotundifolia]
MKLRSPIIRRLFLVSLLLSTLNPSVSDFPRPVPLLDQSLEDTSLVPVTGGFEAEIVLESSEPIKQHDAVLVAALDGTLSLVEVSTRRILWTFKSEHPIYSSYQAPMNLDADDGQSFSRRDDTYMDCGDDWELYVHDRLKGIKKRYKFNAQGFLNLTPVLSENGSMITGQMTTSTIAVDATTGAVIWAIGPSGSSGLSSSFVENPVVLKETDANMETKIIGGQQLTITRKDYTFTGHSMLSGQVLWNLTFAEIEADLSCPGSDRFGAPSILGLEDEIDSRRSGCCRSSVLVYRIRDGGHSGPSSVVDSVDSLPGDVILSLPPVEYPPLPPPKDISLLVPFHEYPSDYHKGRNSQEEWLALPSAEVDYLQGTSMSYETSATRVLWLGALGFFLLFVWSFFTMQVTKQREDPKSKVLAAKKKRTKKSGVMKDHANVDKANSSQENSDELAVDEKIATTSLLNANDPSYAHVDGRRIGKLIVSSSEIAKGSNGTIVLEGIYDGRPVAVKRMVQTHHDMAIKEIQNLIASDQHPNIVRWYGVEFDEDFVYLSLERCTCSLYDLVYLYSGTVQITITSKNMESDFMNNEYMMQLKQKVESDKDFTLWKTNGYPSAQLLKLMRDVVVGLAHLHELGIIHRDLKPQNVLIVKERSLSAKLSDMGISKRLDGDLTSVTHHATGLGSSGWRAPEQLLHGRQSRAVDLFSLGCVLFFCMTGGKHPFGDHFERDVNIVKNQKDLFLVEHMPEAINIITQLLDPNPQLRPLAVEVMYHPLFWSSDTKLSYLRDVSDRVELEDRETDSELLKALEAVASSALGGKWDEKLENAFLNNICKYRRYKYDSVRDLLRVIRNKLNHYRELPKEIQELLGPVPEGFDTYFTSRFPRLLIEVHGVIQKYCVEEEWLSKYFKSSLI